jgi:hypothetical protein
MVKVALSCHISHYDHIQALKVHSFSVQLSYYNSGMCTLESACTKNWQWQINCHQSFTSVFFHRISKPMVILLLFNISNCILYIFSNLLSSWERFLDFKNIFLCKDGLKNGPRAVKKNQKLHVLYVYQLLCWTVTTQKKHTESCLAFNIQSVNYCCLPTFQEKQ